MDNGTTFGEGSWIFGLIVLLGLFGGFGGGFGGNNAAMAGYATMADVNSAINNQTTQNALGQIALSSANNNYETAQLISNQNMQMMSQNNANLVNAIQGFNQISSSVQGGFANISSQIADLGYKMENCCCSIKTQMLQDKLDEANAKIVSQQNEISNAQQTQTILNTLGRFVAWAGSGSQTASTSQG